MSQKNPSLREIKSGPYDHGAEQRSLAEKVSLLDTTKRVSLADLKPLEPAEVVLFLRDPE